MTRVLIVGGGIAGLSAGSYLQMNGYETEIFELHRAGGLCTSWKRKGYTIDGCIHWWVGVNPKDPFYPTLDGLFDMESLPKIVYEEFWSMEGEEKVLRFMGNLDKFEAELKAISPQDGKSIEELISMARKMASLSLPGDKAPEVMNLWEKLRIMGKMLPVKRIFNTGKLTIDEFAQRFQSPLIRKFISLFSWWEGPILGIIMNAACFHNKNAGYPIGGAEELTKRLVQRYQSLGGKLHEYSKVNKIVVEEGVAKAIELENGKKYRGDYIVSAADGHDTVVRMLGEPYADKEKKKLYFSKKFIPRKSYVYVSLGVAREFKDSYKPYVYFFLKKPLKIGKSEITNVGVTIHNFDPTSAPQGKTLLTMMLPVYDTEYWVKMRGGNRSEYEVRKKEIADHLIEEIDTHFGNVKNKVEMIDVATPVTYIRHTNNWNGCSGWDDFSLSINKPKKEIKGLKNFYMCGHWVGDVGISGAAQSGRDVAQILCKKDGKKFTPLKRP
jgi:phytoene dehydrogenase-like protein